MNRKYNPSLLWLFTAFLLLSACSLRPAESTLTPQPQLQPAEITGTYKVTNDFVLSTYYVENAVALTDMHGFVTRNMDWELPVDSQTLGFMTFDPETLQGTFQLDLPLLPEGEFNDVDQNQSADTGVQIFAIAYSPNVYAGPFAEGDDRSRGWPSYLASVRTDSENKDEVIGGKLVVWSPDDKQSFPSGFGDDGLLFTADDPVSAIPAGYSIVDLDTEPFVVSQDAQPKMELYEPADIAIKDYSDLSYTEAFDKMFDVIRREYAFTDMQAKAPAWDALYDAIKLRVAQAEKNQDANAFYLALRDFTWAFQDGHVGLDGGDYAQQDFTDTTAGGYGFSVRELDDGRVIVIYVLEGGPAQLAGIQVGAQLTAFNDQPILEAIAAAQSYSNQSSDFAIRYQKARYMLRAVPGTEARVDFTNPDGIPQTVTLAAVEERQSFSRTSLYYGVDTSSLLPVDAEIITSDNASLGYIRINSNYDDLNLVIRLFERALKQFQSAKVAGIVIDMRYNDGGAPLGLAGFLTDKEILMGQLEYFSEKSGKFEPEGLREKVFPNQNQYQFDKTVLLVGPACFSACEIEAYGFSQVPGMVVVGQYPTGGVEAETARGSFQLPEGFSLTVPTGRFTLPDGSIFLEGQGVPPTLKVPVDLENALSSEDVVLQAGIKAVLLPLGAGIVPDAPPHLASAAESASALDAGTPFLEELARESYQADAFSAPGTVSYTIPLDESKSLIWSYVWCAADADTLAANFKQIQLAFSLNGTEVPAKSFTTREVESGDQLCRVIYTALTDWTAGEHQLLTTATFKSSINDGSAEYEPGQYILNYKVYIKP